MPLTPAQARANAKYDSKTYLPFRVKPRIGETNDIKRYAAERGESITRFVCRACYAQMERDKEETNG